MINKKIRIGFLGAGRVAQHYKKIFDDKMVKNYKIVAVCDIRSQVAKRLADYWGCDFYLNLDSMLENANLDLLIVLTPSGMHFQHAYQTLNSGVHVLVEKPLTMTVAESENLFNLAKKKNLMCGVVFQNRLNPSIIALKQAIESGRFGKITTATVRLRWCRYQEYYNDNWHGTWAQDGGVINQQAIHHVDIINWLIGPVNEVCASMTNRLNILEAEDTMVALLRFSNGALGTIEATTAARPNDIEASISVIGEKGYVVIGGIALNKIESWHFLDANLEDKIIPSKYSQEVPTGYGLSHSSLLQVTIDNIRKSNFLPVIPIEESISSTQLIHAIYKSCEDNSWISLKAKPISKKLGKNI